MRFHAARLATEKANYSTRPASMVTVERSGVIA